MVVLLAALVLAGCRGCQGGTRPRYDKPVLAAVTVTRASSTTVQDKPIHIDEAALVAKARATLADTGVFTPASPESRDRPKASLGIEVDVLGQGEPPDVQLGVKVRIRIDVHPSNVVTARYAEDTTAIGQAPVGDSESDLGVSFQRLAERTAADLLSAYAERQRLWSAADADVAKVLASDNADLRLEAIRIAGVRKLRSQLPALIHLLSDDDEATRDAALGALVAIGDRSVVRALADSRQMRDSYEMSKILDAVATLGGQEARDYLSFVGETHDDPDIRSMAKAALERLRKRDVDDRQRDRRVANTPMKP